MHATIFFRVGDQLQVWDFCWMVSAGVHACPLNKWGNAPPVCVDELTFEAIVKMGLK